MTSLESSTNSTGRPVAAYGGCLSGALKQMGLTYYSDHNGFLMPVRPTLPTSVGDIRC